MEESQRVVVPPPPPSWLLAEGDAWRWHSHLTGRSLSPRRLHFVPAGYEAPAKMTQREMQCDSSSYGGRWCMHRRDLCIVVVGGNCHVFVCWVCVHFQVLFLCMCVFVFKFMLVLL